MLGQENVRIVVAKITICAGFVREVLWYFVVKRIKFAQTGKLHFDRHQLLLHSNYGKKNFIGGVAVKTCGFRVSKLVVILTNQIQKILFA